MIAHRSRRSCSKRRAGMRSIPSRSSPLRASSCEQHYHLDSVDIAPRVFWRLTDNWLEMTVRFLSKPHGTRSIKDEMGRDILAALDEAGIGIASATYDIVGLPPITLRTTAETMRNG